MTKKKRVVKHFKCVDDLLSETCSVALTRRDVMALDRMCKVDEHRRSFVLRKALREFYDRWGK